MIASPRTVTAIQGWEGLRLNIYADQNGHATIGYGHLLTHAELASGIYLNGISSAGAWTLLAADLTLAEQIVKVQLSKQFGVYILSQGKFDALTSFTFNLGANDLAVMLAHGWAQVPVQMPRWVYAAGVVDGPLVKRRAMELTWWNEEAA
jgi:GH24 family phage-related lysozyme (muramidase)